MCLANTGQKFFSPPAQRDAGTDAQARVITKGMAEKTMGGTIPAQALPNSSRGI